MMTFVDRDTLEKQLSSNKLISSEDEIIHSKEDIVEDKFGSYEGSVLIPLIYSMALQEFEDRNIVLIILTFSESTSLHWFSGNGDQNVVRALITLGADVHAKDTR